MAMTRIRFFGVAAYEIITRRGQHILMDPFLDENPGSPIKSHQLEGKRVPNSVVMKPGEFYECAAA